VAASDRPISIGAVFRRVAACAALVKPIVAIGIGWSVVSWLPLFLQASTGFQTWAGSPGSPRSVLLGSLVAILGLVVGVAVIVLAVRWALYIPAVLSEELGVGEGLARAARLTSGIRVRLGLAIAGIVILQALSIGLVAASIGIVAGIAARSLATGFWTYTIATLIGQLLWAPFVPAMLVLAYRERATSPEP
jgi:hypothetical protein